MSDILGDLLSLTTADGLNWTLPDGERFVISSGGFGAPPTTFVTAQAFRQSNLRERDVLYGRRELSLTFHQLHADDRARYWQARAELIDLFRFNRGGPLTLTLRTAAGRRRAIDVYGEPGPMLPATDPAGDVWLVEEALTLLALDPLWRNPVAVVRTGVRTIEAAGFVFPLTLPFTFGHVGAQYVFNEQYAGSYDSTPTFVVTGPYQSISFTNEASGASFTLNAALAAGEQRTIRLEPTARALIDANRVSKFGDLAPGADLARFRLLAAPAAPDGAQTIRVSVVGSDGSTTVQMSYYERYIGV